MLESLGLDLRYAVRQLRHRLIATSIIVFSLAVAIASNAVVFSLANRLFWSSLPVNHPEELVVLGWSSTSWPTGIIESGPVGHDKAGRLFCSSFSYPTFQQFRTQDRLFTAVFGFVDVPNVNMSADGKTILTTTQLVTGGYFPGLRVRPIAGRTITEEDEYSVQRVAVIRYGYWTREFGRDPSAVGRQISLNGEPFTIIGITGPDFFGVEAGREPDVWVPISAGSGFALWGSEPPPGRSALTARDWWWLQIMGRLRPGVTISQSEPVLESILHRDFEGSVSPAPGDAKTPHIEFESGARGMRNLGRQLDQPLFIVSVIAALVLLIACANAATLLSAFVSDRRQEIAIRMAIGASRRRLIRQLLIESTLRALIAGVVGLALAYWASQGLFLILSPGAEHIRLEIHLAGGVLAFTGMLSLLTGILFGLAPALVAARGNVNQSARGNGWTFSRDGHRTRLRVDDFLVTAQVAISVVLLVIAGLFVRTSWNLHHQDLGFDKDNLLLFGIDPTREGYKGGRLFDFYEKLTKRLEDLPDVVSVTSSELTLVSGWANETLIEREDGPERFTGYVQWNAVGPGFVHTMALHLLAGRDLDWHDMRNSAKVAIVNRELSERFYGQQNPIGRRFRFADPDATLDSFEIVGVVGDAKFDTLRHSSPPTAYIPYADSLGGLGSLHFEVRALGNPRNLIPSVRQATDVVDPNVVLFDVRTQRQQIDDSLAGEALLVQLSITLGIIAVALASIGLYATVMHRLSQRTKEIAVRLALGATPKLVVWMSMRRSLVLVSSGIAIAWLLVVLGSRIMASMVFGIPPFDIATMLIVTLIVMIVVAVSTYVPSCRVTKVDPLLALRYE